MQQNYWNYDNHLQNVGGIIGFALEECLAYCTGLFQSYTGSLEHMTVALSPETDFDWWLKSRDVGEVKENAFDY
jgi:hypothetical protein